MTQKTAMDPVFSVIVPVYKVEDYLRECVDSILGQTYTGFELILVDDGSPDGCPAICDEYARRDPRVRVIHKKNGGLADARHAGLGQAGGEYICFVDSDDWVAPFWLETIRRHIDENDGPDMLLYGLIWVYADRAEEHPMTIPAGYYDKARLEAELYPRMLYDRSRPFLEKAVQGHICAKIARRELLERHFANDPSITRLEDDAMAYECLYSAGSVYVCEEQFYYYRQREQSIMGRYHDDALTNTAALCDYMQAHLGSRSEDLRDQVNAYMTFWTIRNIADEFRAGHGVPEAVRNVRRQMRASGLAGKLRFAGLPLYIKAFVLLLKLRLYGAAVLLTKSRMGNEEG